MILTEEDKERIKDCIIKKASNNSDNQAYIHPSEFGFAKDSDGTSDFKSMLPDIIEYKECKVQGKDLLEITL